MPADRRVCRRAGDLLADLLDRDLTAARLLQQRVAALGAVGVEVLPVDLLRMQVAAVEQRAHRSGRGMAEVAVSSGWSGAHRVSGVSLIC